MGEPYAATLRFGEICKKAIRLDDSSSRLTCEGAGRAVYTSRKCKLYVDGVEVMQEREEPLAGLGRHRSFCAGEQ